ncbi:MAG: SDR family oxidoreductase, partial [Chloroflexi bacterium]|nr:SDR family oxidoreductase [Chloroflexota bacterium]
MATVQELFDLRGRVAIVTGAAGLLGRRHCEALLEAGAAVVVADLDGGRAAETAAALTGSLDRAALGLQADVADPASVASMVERAVAEFGRVDILVNNAALTVKGGSVDVAGYFAPFEDYPLELWNKAIAINLTGMFLCAQAAGRQMLRQGGGVIVNIASTYGVVAPDQRLYEGVKSPYADIAFNTPASYAVTKGAVLSLTRYLATYWAGRNIRVNSLAPHGVFDGHDETFVRNFSSRSPLGRMAHRDEYKGALLFLASDASSYMTG